MSKIRSIGLISIILAEVESVFSTLTQKLK